MGAAARVPPSLLYPEPVAELRRVDNPGDAGPARHEQHRRLGVPPRGFGCGRGRGARRGGLLPARRGRPLPEERAELEELVRQVPGEQLAAAALGRRRRHGRRVGEPRQLVRLVAQLLSPGRRRREQRLPLLRRRRVLPVLPLPERAAAWRVHPRADRHPEGPDARLRHDCSGRTGSPIAAGERGKYAKEKGNWFKKL